MKYFDYATTFTEFPDEIALCINITNCPGMCKNCSEPWLREDSGEELTTEELDKLIEKERGISLVGFMGGDANHSEILRLSKYIHEKHPTLKVGMYSGMDNIDLELAKELDCYKIGHWIIPEGDSTEWFKTNNGPLSFPWSNQLYFERVNNTLKNSTWKFRTKQLNNYERAILKDGEK